MTAGNFDEMQNHIQQLYASKEYSAALELATQAIPLFPDQVPVLDYWRMCMAVRVGDNRLALRVLQDRLNAGFWYGEVLLRKSPSLQPLQGDPLFERMFARNQELHSADPDLHYPMIILRAPGGCQGEAPACPLLIGLHTNAGKAQSSLDFWKLAAQSGCLVAIPQSSQAVWKGSYVWNDMEQARTEIQRHFSNLSKNYRVNLEQVVLAGHSMGGELAIWLALTGAIPARGFVVFGPAGPMVDNTPDWEPVISQAAESGLKGYFVVGENDQTVSFEGIRSLIDMLNQKNIPCDLEIVPGAGHEHSHVYDGCLIRGLDYVLDA